MLKFGIRNLRRLKSVDPIELRPITLLVGKNSSGKSTFLRTMPLFRQSVTTRTNSPILWYGDLVDFGSFDVSVSTEHKNKPMTFSFVLDEIYVNPFRGVYWEDRRKDGNSFSNVEIDISILPTEKRTFISSINIRMPSVEIDYYLAFDSAGRMTELLLNKENVINVAEEVPLVINLGSLFPELRPVLKVSSGSVLGRVSIWPAEQGRFIQKAFELFRRPLDDRVGDKTLTDFLIAVFQSTITTEKSFFEMVSKVNGKIFKGFLDHICEDDPKGLLPQLKTLVAVRSLSAILAGISAQLRGVFSSTLYIGPARARSERYYRYQDFAVSEIDPDGKNFPMFLNSLNRRQRQNLSDWIQGLYGYGVNVIQETGHISIKLIEGKTEVNVVDVGYGVSQILPVLAQIWWSKARPQANNTNRLLNILAIEQPELHLHPAHQALLADALVGEASLSGASATRQPRSTFIIETHSETLVNKLGELIARGKISSTDVQIILFEKDEADQRSTAVRTVSYDDDGLLIDWPYGFFQAEVF